MTAFARQARLSDVWEVAQNIRPQDKDEVDASTGGGTPQDALLTGLMSSRLCMTVVVGEKPIAIFGVVGNPKTPAVIWMMGTDGVAKFKKAFSAVAKEKLKWLLTIYPVLYNWVDDRNTVSLLWLGRNGATIQKPKPWGARGMMFRKFEIRGAV